MKANSKEPDPQKQAVEPPVAEAAKAGNGGPPQKSVAQETEELCAYLERLFRRACGEMPKAAEVGELRAEQSALRGLVARAAAESADSGEKIEALTAERDKLKDALVRAHADFLNYQARTTKDLQRAEELALRNYVAEVLPVLDSLDLALKDAASAQKEAHRLKDALGLIANSLNHVLAVRGLERISVGLGKPLDLQCHEAVATRPADAAKGEKPDTVLEELRPGYLWKGLVLRPAQVLVANPEKPAAKG